MPFAGNLAADFLSVSLSDKLWDAHVKQYEMKPSVDLKPQATFAQRHRLLCIQLTSSPGLHWPINFQPYGFQLWLLADVCPTHHSIWFTGDLLSPFGNFGDSTRFWLSVFIRWIGVFPKVELRPSVAIIYAWKWTQLPAVPAITPGSPCLCLPVKFVFRLEEYLWTDWIIYSNI